MTRSTAFLLASLFATGVHAETFTGRVVGVSDGDTITVLVELQQAGGCPCRANSAR